MWYVSQCINTGYGQMGERKVCEVSEEAVRKVWHARDEEYDELDYDGYIKKVRFGWNTRDQQEEDELVAELEANRLVLREYEEFIVCVADDLDKAEAAVDQQLIDGA